MARAAKLETVPTQERVSVLETKVEIIDEKVDELKADVRDMHDCLDRTRDGINAKLDNMLDEYRESRDKFYDHANKLHQEQSEQHNVLAGKLTELEKFKAKWTYLILGGIAVFGWMTAYWDTVQKFIK